MNYSIYYYLAGVWVRAGEVSFKIDSTTIKNKPYYHFKAYGETLKKYDWVYKVRDHYESFVSKDGMKPLRFRRTVNEGGTHIKEDYVFNFDKKKAITLRQMDENNPFVKDTVDLNGCSYDVLTMIYIARNLDYSNLKKGDRLPINLFIDNKSNDSYIEYLGKKQVNIPDLGKFNCIVFSPLLIEGTIFSSGEGMTVYVTDDQNRVPLLIETPILVGSIRARVNKMVGLKYSLSSEVKD